MMKTRLILETAYVLKGWQRLPFAIVHTQRHAAMFMNSEQFKLVLKCSGKKEMDMESLPDGLKQFLQRLLEQGIVRPAAPGETRNLYYQFYENRFKTLAQWSITGKCNYKCRHCFQSAPHGELMQLTLAQCREIIGQLAQCGVQNVALTGGEPLVHPDFLAIADELAANGIGIARIYTNGRLVNQALLDALTARNIHPEFQISFDGVGWHDWMRGVPGAEAHALDAVRLLNENHFDVRCAMVICRENIGSLAETTKALAAAGCRGLKVQLAVPDGMWESQREHYLSYDEAFQAYLDYIPQFARDGAPLSLDLEALFHYNAEKKTYRIKDDTCGDSPQAFIEQSVCRTLYTTFYLSYDGTVVPCMGMDANETGVRLPNILETPLREILSDSSYLQLMDARNAQVIQHNPECAVCEYLCKCCSGCRAHALKAHPGDYLAKDPVSCKIYKEAWDKRVYEAADRYFMRASKTGM